MDMLSRVIQTPHNTPTKRPYPPHPPRTIFALFGLVFALQDTDGGRAACCCEGVLAAVVDGEYDNSRVKRKGNKQQQNVPNTWYYRRAAIGTIWQSNPENCFAIQPLKLGKQTSHPRQTKRDSSPSPQNENENSKEHSWNPNQTHR